MKKILQIIIFFSITISSACDCVISNFTEKYSHADFVAEIKITKTYPNQGNKELYKSDIQILNLFKGDSLNSIYVVGRSDENMGSSCDIYIPEETQLLAYAYKNEDGKYLIEMCSGLTYTKNHYYINDEKVIKEKEMLSVLKKENKKLINRIRFDNNGYLNEQLNQFRGVELNKEFSLFEIKFSSDLKVKQVKVISGFEKDLDKKLVDILKSIEWRSFNNGVKNKIPENTKMLFEIHYYPGEKGNSSFLSRNFL